MNAHAGTSSFMVSQQLCQQFGGMSALVYAYMRSEAIPQGGVYTGSRGQLAAALSVPEAALGESLRCLEEAQLLRDITPERGELAHAFVVRPPVEG